MYLSVKIFNNGLIVACPPLIVFVVVAAADLLENLMVCCWWLLAEVMELDHFQTVEDVDTMLFCWTLFFCCSVPSGFLALFLRYMEIILLLAGNVNLDGVGMVAKTKQNSWYCCDFSSQ